MIQTLKYPPEWKRIRRFGRGVKYTLPIKNFTSQLQELAEGTKGLLLHRRVKVSPWTYEKQQAYIQHLLMGGVDGRSIFFNCRNWNYGQGTGHLQIVDGLERVKALLQFLDNDVSVFGEWLYDDFKDTLTSTESDYRLDVYVNDLDTEEEECLWCWNLNYFSRGAEDLQEIWKWGEYYASK